MSQILKRKQVYSMPFFAMQCRPLDILSTLPPFAPHTSKKLSTFSLDESKVASIIQKLNSKKARGFDGISIAMLKICSKEVARPLTLIFRHCLTTGNFPSQWKKANVQPIHKKDSRQDKNNYRPISLLPICGKIFEKIIFDEIYCFLTKNNLISRNQ